MRNQCTSENEWVDLGWEKKKKLKEDYKQH